MAILLVTDNSIALGTCQELAAQYLDIDIYQSPGGSLTGLSSIDLSSNVEQITTGYDLVLSVHSRQLFPGQLISSVRCINVHPGLNPYNRGWFPHVFSILNGLPAGVTIHEMTEDLDHGPIIVQAECPVRESDTSGSLYGRLMQVERDLLIDNFELIRSGSYRCKLLSEQGNLNYKKDYQALLELDLGTIDSLGNFLNRLRALTHGDYRNAFFYDENGSKVYVRVSLDRDAPGETVDSHE